MAHHSLRRAPGGWYGVLTPQDLDFLDRMQFQSIDGDTGGTWNPSAWIMLGGDYGLRIAATATLDCLGNGNILGDVVIGTTSGNTFRCESYSTFNGMMHLHGTLYAHGNINSEGNCDLCTDADNSYIVRGVGHFYENVTFDKAVTVSGTTNLNGNTILGDSGSDTVTVNANTTVNGIFSFHESSTTALDGTTTFGGPVTFQQTGDALTINRPVTLNNAITAGANGYLAKRRLVTGVGATVSLVDYDYVKIPEAGGAVYLADDGDNGAVIRIVNASTGTLQIRTVGDSHILRTLPAHTWADLMRDSTWGAYGWSSWGEGTHTELV